MAVNQGGTMGGECLTFHSNFHGTDKELLRKYRDYDKCWGPEEEDQVLIWLLVVEEGREVGGESWKEEEKKRA